MLNKIIIMGRLTRDPELRQTQTQIPVASFSLAVDRDYSGKDGAEKQVDFIDVVAWRSTAEFVKKYFSKGKMVVVSGRLQLRDWQDRDGNKRRSAEVVAENVYFGESKHDSDNRASGGQSGYGQQSYSSQGGYGSQGGQASAQGGYPASDYGQFAEEDDDGDLPF